MNSKHWDILEGISLFTPVIPLFIGLCFLVALLFNIGFYCALNLNLSTIPISFMDVTNSTIKVSITAILAILIGYFFRIDDKSLNTNEIGRDDRTSQDQTINKTIFVNNKSLGGILKDRFKNIVFISLIILLILSLGIRVQFVLFLMAPLQIISKTRNYRF